MSLLLSDESLSGVLDTVLIPTSAFGLSLLFVKTAKQISEQIISMSHSNK